MSGDPQDETQDDNTGRCQFATRVGVRTPETPLPWGELEWVVRRCVLPKHTRETAHLIETPDGKQHCFPNC